MNIKQNRWWYDRDQDKRENERIYENDENENEETEE